MCFFANVIKKCAYYSKNFYYADDNFLMRVSDDIMYALASVFTATPRKQLHITDVLNCLRMSFYQRQKVLPTNVQMLIGTATHRQFQSVLNAKYVEHEYTLQIDGMRIVGHPDIITRDDHVIELKHISTFYLLRKYTDNMPIPRHIDQVLLYLLMSGCKFAYIVYVSLNEGFRVFKIRRTHANMRDFFKRARILDNAIKNNTPPDPEPSFLCSRCAFRKMCNVTPTSTFLPSVIKANVTPERVQSYETMLVRYVMYVVDRMPTFYRGLVIGDELRTSLHIFYADAVHKLLLTIPIPDVYINELKIDGELIPMLYFKRRDRKTKNYLVPFVAQYVRETLEPEVSNFVQQKLSPVIGRNKAFVVRMSLDGFIRIFEVI